MGVGEVGRAATILLKSYHIAIRFLTIRVLYCEIISRYANDTALIVIY